jgi:hypothetical protein
LNVSSTIESTIFANDDFEISNKDLMFFVCVEKENDGLKNDQTLEDFDMKDEILEN